MINNIIIAPYKLSYEDYVNFLVEDPTGLGNMFVVSDTYSMLNNVDIDNYIKDNDMTTNNVAIIGTLFIDHIFTKDEMVELKDTLVKYEDSMDFPIIVQTDIHGLQIIHSTFVNRVEWGKINLHILNVNHYIDNLMKKDSYNILNWFEGMQKKVNKRIHKINLVNIE